MSAGRIILALFVVTLSNALFHFQLYDRHWTALAVLPAVTFLFFFLLYAVQKIVGALYPEKGWSRVVAKGLAWPLGFVGLIFIWWNQPYFGGNLCPLTGFMRESDFVEEMRPTLLDIVDRELRREQRVPPAGQARDSARKTADRAINLLKQCVAERGRDFCRYIGPDNAGHVAFARTHTGPSSMRAEDEHKYRMFHDGGFEIWMRPQDAGGTDFKLRIFNGDPLVVGDLVCYLGCDCNRDYHRR